MTFEPVSTGIESVFEVKWYLKAFVSVGQLDSDMGMMRVKRLIPGTEVTIGFG